MSNSAKEIFSKLDAIFCDPEGMPCFSGSDADRQVYIDVRRNALTPESEGIAGRVDDINLVRKCLTQIEVGTGSSCIREHAALDRLERAITRPQEIDVELVARAMMETVFHEIDVKTASLDWTGNDVWGCDFKAMAQAAIDHLHSSGYLSAPDGKK